MRNCDHGRTLGIALVGCGTVGTGVARILSHHAERITSRAGVLIALEAVVVRDRDRPRDEAVPRNRVCELPAALANPRVRVVCELVGGVEIARRIVLDALAAGETCRHGQQGVARGVRAGTVRRCTHREPRDLLEAAVAGGVPIIRALAESLSANQITAIQGILNGTSNYILTAMADRGA